MQGVDLELWSLFTTFHLGFQDDLRIFHERALGDLLSLS